MPEVEPIVDADFVVDLILEFLEFHFEITPVGDITDGDLPFVERLEVLATNTEVRQAVGRKVTAAQAAGNAFPLPSAQDLAAARERRLAR